MLVHYTIKQVSTIFKLIQVGSTYTRPTYIIKNIQKSYQM